MKTVKPVMRHEAGDSGYCKKYEAKRGKEMSKTLAEKKTEQKERSILRIMSTCVHFTGIQHDSCKAGVNYHSQFGDGAGCFANIACTQAYPRTDVPMKDCPKHLLPNREQAEAEEDERAARSKRGFEAMNAAHADAKAKGFGVGNGGASEMKCPLCTDGLLRYSVASCNGHMHAGCTNGCISWME